MAEQQRTGSQRNHKTRKKSTNVNRIYRAERESMARASEKEGLFLYIKQISTHSFFPLAERSEISLPLMWSST